MKRSWGDGGSTFLVREGADQRPRGKNQDVCGKREEFIVPGTRTSCAGEMGCELHEHSSSPGTEWTTELAQCRELKVWGAGSTEVPQETGRC